jgi:hypothetical protein
MIFLELFIHHFTDAFIIVTCGKQQQQQQQQNK